jgi:hypothetical protein
VTRAIVERLRRVEQQLRALGELQARELGELGERGETLARLHNDELRIAIEEIDAIRTEIGAAVEAAAGAPPVSPKRERWLAEEERKAHPPPMSRRELLRGRADDDAAGEDRERGPDR